MNDNFPETLSVKYLTPDAMFVPLAEILSKRTAQHFSAQHDIEFIGQCGEMKSSELLKGLGNEGVSTSIDIFTAYGLLPSPPSVAVPEQKFHRLTRS